MAIRYGVSYFDESREDQAREQEWQEKYIQRMSISKNKKLFPELHFLKSYDEINELAKIDKQYQRDWSINGIMRNRMGNGIQYRFKRVTEQGYTHQGTDGYYYHELWFDDHNPIIELDDKDFIL